MRLVKRIFMDTSVLVSCYFAFVLPILEYLSPVWASAAECHLQLVKRQVYSVARLCPNQSFLSLCHRRVWLGLVCCTRLILTLITVCSTSFHLPLLEFDILYLQPQLIHWSLRYQGVDRSNRSFVLAQVRMWNNLPYTMFNTETLDGFKGAVKRWLSP